MSEDERASLMSLADIRNSGIFLVGWDIVFVIVDQSYLIKKEVSIDGVP